MLTTGIAIPGEGIIQSRAAEGGPVMDDPPALCDGWHRGAGKTDPVDLGAVRKAYDDLRRRMTARMERIGADATNLLDRPHRSGLPACRGGAVRVESLNLPDAAHLKGLTLAFVSVRDAALRLPDQVRDDPQALVFILDCPSIRDLGEISKSLGRPVYLAEAPFARALGVRCSNTWVRISAKGDTVEIHEGD
jgi:hypothetical protein